MKTHKMLCDGQSNTFDHAGSVAKTAEAAALIRGRLAESDQAVAAVKLAAAPPPECGPDTPLAPAPYRGEGRGRWGGGVMRPNFAPAGKVKRILGVQQLLEWAFGVEKAQIETDPVKAIGGVGLPHVGVEYLLMERMQLGGVRIDTSIGRSLPHEDAEVVAAVLQNLPSARGGLSMAIHIAGLARAGLTPDWMPDARTKVVPVAWRETKHGRFAQTEVVDLIKYHHRGRVVKREVRACPVTYSPSAAKIAAARRGYLDWWGALRDLRCDLKSCVFRNHDLSDVMPPMKPWERP